MIEVSQEKGKGFFPLCIHDEEMEKERKHYIFIAMFASSIQHDAITL